MQVDNWKQLKHRLASTIPSEAYDNWLARTALLRQSGGILHVAVPDNETKHWIEQEYTPLIGRLIREMSLPVQSVSFHIAEQNGNLPNGNGKDMLGEAVSDLAPSQLSSHPMQLNPKFSFDNFVVGASNQFAHAAARAVATSPARSYNPLFIYGAVGVGKTHLLHAIGRTLQNQHAGLRVVYTSSERFMNEMISCMQSHRMSQFHKHYRSADVLLIDDIQILAGKERTQDEFFHTFNELYDHQKQIVISSDSAPRLTAGVSDRLKSRFEWGLLVDIQPPDLETKMAILDNKARMEGVDLPNDVRVFIATRTKSNVRELEGALIKLIAYSSVTGTRINLAMAQQILKHLACGSERRVNAETIIRAVAEHFRLQPHQLKLKTNARHIAYPRQIAMYLMKELTRASLPEIGKLFGNKHHTTVLHSVQKIDRERHKDPELARLLTELIDGLQ